MISSTRAINKKKLSAEALLYKQIPNKPSSPSEVRTDVIHVHFKPVILVSAITTNILRLEIKLTGIHVWLKTNFNLPTRHESIQINLFCYMNTAYYI